MASAHEGSRFLRECARHQLVGKAQWIIVVTDKIELRGQRSIIDAGRGGRNDVVRHPLIRPGMTPDRRNHDVMKTHNLIGGKPAIGKPVRGVGFAHGEEGQLDLVEGVIFHRPEDIAPCGIERLYIAITILTPRAESISRSR